jgi:translation initiation factor 2 gamma subunit (eIF-2gamma)
MDVLLIPRMCDPYTEKIYDPLPPVEAGEQLLLIIGTMSTYGWVREASAGRKKRTTTIVVTGLSPPTCARHRESILICRSFMLSWHLIGSGTVLGGSALDQKALPLL